ncbi:MAG: hypothetical protein R3B57_02895 [Phycisphaerales bacterium]
MRHLVVIAAVVLGGALDRARGDDDAAALAGIQTLLIEMSEAVTAGDIGDYLSHIAPEDVTYLTEQRNWAADLRDHPVHDFVIRLVDPSKLTVSEHGWAVGEVEMRWRLGEFEPRHSVKFPARFVPAGAIDGAWFFGGESWRVVYDDRHGAPCRALAPDGLESVALQIVEVLPSVRERVDEMFGIDNQREVQVKVYESVEHLQASIYLSYEEPLGGWNEPGEAIKLLAGPSLGAMNLRHLLAHEYGHAATFTLGERVDDAPWWTLEGVAELASDRAGGQSGGARARMVRDWKARGVLKDWDQLDDFRGEANMYAQWVYVQGWSMLRYITDRFGDGARNDWMTLLVSGEPLEGATRQALGTSFADLDRAWRGSIDANATPARAEEAQEDVEAVTPEVGADD